MGSYFHNFYPWQLPDTKVHGTEIVNAFFFYPGKGHEKKEVQLGRSEWVNDKP